MTFEEEAALLSKEQVVALLVANEALQTINEKLQASEKSLQSANENLQEKLKEKMLKVVSQDEKIAKLEAQVKWFERQYFGQKTEKRIVSLTPSKQLSLGEILEVEETPPPPTKTVKAYERQQRKQYPEFVDDESQLRFDESVPVKVINVPNPELEQLATDKYIEISEKVTHRLAQYRGPYVVLKYVQKVAKIKDSGAISCPAVPSAIIEKSVADVSFLAGLAIDKMAYHLPLYRQHQRLEKSGIHLSRATLTNLIIRTSQLLEPIYLSLLSSILQSKVIGMDETPVKAGRSKPGKMQQGYFWPIYGEKDEIVFLFAASRGLKVVSEALKEYTGVLITDGYSVYERFAASVPGVQHAQCWVHTRRNFFEAQESKPALCQEAMAYIGKLYSIEELCKGKEPEEVLAIRAEESRVVVNEFFSWLKGVFNKEVLLPSNPFTKAANYALEREKALRVFLENPAVPLDTNHVERALRPIPLGRKNWLFCWSEVGARCVGIFQSLIASCKFQGVDPYVYLVDVLQRIDTHKIHQVHLLTPRLWKEHFAANPLISDLEKN